MAELSRAQLYDAFVVPFIRKVESQPAQTGAIREQLRADAHRARDGQWATARRESFANASRADSAFVKLNMGELQLRALEVHVIMTMCFHPSRVSKGVRVIKNAAPELAEKASVETVANGLKDPGPARRGLLPSERPLPLPLTYTLRRDKDKYAARDGYTPRNMTLWQPYDVARFVWRCGFPGLSRRFLAARIDGRQLCAMDHNTLRGKLRIMNRLTRRKILYRISSAMRRASEHVQDVADLRRPSITEPKPVPVASAAHHPHYHHQQHHHQPQTTLQNYKIM
eukprot:TRINITY_DN66022_c6_g3_i1.p1 TRINITY_DN66022_c6_g3~~TRINITY_DN66022_c6_g3_i1.p1  ORF type:complete len:310 (+),score=136.77 TRINITY_DN66022_c6_g3_i1:83-931(+)